MRLTQWAIATVVAGIALCCPGAAVRAAEPIHGANSEFSSPDVKLIWAVLKGNTGDGARVVIRVVNTARAYTRVRVDGIDPFTNQKAVLVDTRPIESSVDLSIPRSKFGDFPKSEIHLFGSDGDARANKPALTVYYLGVPDTTPEFLSDSAMRNHFDRMLASMK